MTTALISALCPVQDMVVSIKSLSLSKESVAFLSQIEQIRDINRIGVHYARKRLIRLLLGKNSSLVVIASVFDVLQTLNRT